MGTRIDMIGIFVRDLHRMVAFYRDTLGFEIVWMEKDPMRSSATKGFASRCTSGRSCRSCWVRRRRIPMG